jgi:hypothetical protein
VNPEPIQPDRPAPLVPDSTGSGTSGTGHDTEHDDGDDAHLGWRLSALLDGELVVPDELRAREHLRGCDRCQQEFVEVTAARAFVRGLGDVEPPQGYLDRVLTRVQRRNQSRLGLVSLVTIAAIWIVVLLIGAGVALPSVSPEVELLAEQHADVAADPTAVADGDEVRVVSNDEAAAFEAPYVLPAELGSDHQRVAAYERGHSVLQGVYQSGDSTVSLFEQEGTLDWESLPDGGDVREVEGRRIWVSTLDGGSGPDRHVVVVPDYPVVYTLVTTGDAAGVLELAPEVPDPQGYTWGDRARRNVETWLERLGLD